MKKMLLLAGVASVFAFNANAFDFSPYLSAKAKYAITENSVDSAVAKRNIDKDLFGGSGAIGLRVPFCNKSAFRIEAEYNRTADAKKTFSYEGLKSKGELRVQALMFNAYYDFATGTHLTPYVGAGMGGARLKYSEHEKAIHQTELAWQLGFGVAYDFNSHWSADLGYRYIDYGKFKSHGVEVESKANEIMLGARYTF